ncbi:hypothetical protein TL16_g00544, partial [Triparma laevis f. inornata]
NLKDYQLEGLNWMIHLRSKGLNGILADEMGLGKTLQSISILAYVRSMRINGPHLICVPKSTLSNWMNELARWCPALRAVRFHGPKDERALFVEKYFNNKAAADSNFDVVVTTYEIANMEKKALAKFSWEYLVIDEAHRLKNEASMFATTVRGFHTKNRLLLTGTPLQNNLHELWALLNFLLPDIFSSADQFDDWFNFDRKAEQEQLSLDAFEDKFGDLAEGNLLEKLHSVIGTYILRRLKDDVEKSVPPKEETILNCPMPLMQKKQYRAIYEKNIKLLAVDNGNSVRGPSLMNVAMELRKCCNHPFLIDLKQDWIDGGGDKKDEKGYMSAACGKFKFLDKLLPKLFSGGHRVLMFSQFVMMLDVLEDYLYYKGYDFCRIDGSITGPKRQAAIDRFQGKKSSMATTGQTDKSKLPFVMLLSTRAGGVGINLTAADTCIIYDSDWNPQNDLQAQARCHRIGQTKKVTVYRLVTMNSYEEQML